MISGPSPEELREIFNYNPETGELFRKRPDHGVRLGRPCGSVYSNGYRMVSVNKVDISAHRLIWAWYYGEWPTEYLDHINGNRDDNRIENLRQVDHYGNMQNKTAPMKNNTSGYLGVFARRQGFLAQIQANGVRYRSKQFDTAEEAYKEYLKMKREKHIETTIQ